ncbi:hypothetical protein shn_14835 [Shinella sp. HZN7]|nr:hypothetical protein shn_14835 [Shinella sp. HZN7]
MTIISGRLEYLGWKRPWKVDGGSNAADLSREFWQFAEQRRGKPIKHVYDRDNYMLKADDASEFDLNYIEAGEGIIAQKREGFGMFNVAAYLEWALLALNGRQIIATITPGGFWLTNAPNEDVPGVVFQREGNMGVVPPGMERAICKVGQGAECCIFLCGGSTGLECAKFDPAFARQILDRKARGQMNADRIGDCRLLGRQGAQ